MGLLLFLGRLLLLLLLLLLCLGLFVLLGGLFRLFGRGALLLRLGLGRGLGRLFGSGLGFSRSSTPSCQLETGDINQRVRKGVCCRRTGGTV